MKMARRPGEGRGEGGGGAGRRRGNLLQEKVKDEGGQNVLHQLARVVGQLAEVVKEDKQVEGLCWQLARPAFPERVRESA